MLGGIALGILPGAPTARAENDRNVSIALFRGELGSGSNVTVGSWGSGSAEQSKEHVYVGDSSILLTTEGLYQGGRLGFNNPVDLTEAFQNPNAYLRMRVRFTGAGSTQNAYDPESLQTTRTSASPFDRMRFVLTMADGTTRELVRPISLQPTDDPEGYSVIAFPLAALLKKPDGSAAAAPTGDGAKLKQLAIFGDKFGTLNIGEINVLTDETPISVTPPDVPPAFTNDAIPFVASAEGGASTLKYTWDFDASDGIQVDAEGSSVSHIYTKPGKYKVTLTVSDIDGIKKPVTETIDLDVSG